MRITYINIWICVYIYVYIYTFRLFFSSSHLASIQCEIKWLDHAGLTVECTFLALPVSTCIESGRDI